MSFKHFTIDEFECKCGCGQNAIKRTFVHRLDQLRELAGFPFVINSGYRCADHPAEAAKDTPGQHTAGLAADIAVSDGRQRYLIQKFAYRMGFAGIGPAKEFVHIDDRGGIGVSWVY